MKKWEKAYLAGYLEGRAFNLRWKDGTWWLQLTTGTKHSYYLGRISKMIGGKLFENETTTFNEPFFNDGRPAVYRDGRSVRTYLYLKGSLAQPILKSLVPYFDPQTIKRISKFLNHKFNKSGKSRAV